RRTRRIRRRRATVGAVAAALLVTGGTVAGISVLSPDKEEADKLRTAATPGTPLPTASASSPSASPSDSPSPEASPSRTKKPSKSPSPKPKPTTPKPKPTTQRPTATADPADTPGEQVLALVNSERGKAGCKPVKYDSRLARAAQLHSEDMSANNYFDHTSQDGRTFADRAKAQGYDNPGAENIARGQNSPESVMDAWMNSQGHRENILNCGLTTMGLGVVTKDWTWTQVFGW
ncbi:CAP domain-containing protein, partial [Streptomyces sp. T-3]|nr:CAP domain-containing protein [Streptomyces sp. T-3]